MDIYQIGRRTRISLKSLRKLEALNVLKLDEAEGPLSELLFHMRGNQTFSLPMLLQMIADPDLIEDISYANQTYGRRARDQIAALGDLSQGLPGKPVTAAIDGTAKGDPIAAQMIADWLRDVLPAEPVKYPWIAVRLMLPLNDFLREKAMPIVPLALMHMRKLEAFRPYWESIENKSGRKEIRYFQPKTLDL